MINFIIGMALGFFFGVLIGGLAMYKGGKDK